MASNRLDRRRGLAATALALTLAAGAMLPVLADEGLDWMVWTCLAGAGLGCLGLEYCRRRRAARTRRDAEREVSP